ncbi:MAG: 50S ribosomal protein L3, partial [Actinomycetota bacterium]
MMGRMGVETVTVQNLTVQAVDVEKSLILIKGAIPGRTGAQVLIHSASKKALSEVINKAGA